MVLTEASLEHPPDSLLAIGWRQGALFQLPGARFVVNAVAQSGTGEVVSPAFDAIKTSERLVLITQDCDILATDEPNVEALKCRVMTRPKDRAYLARIANRSYRQFVLDLELGLVADARFKVNIAKDVLRSIEIDPWVMDDRTKANFVDWLAGRYDRPPVPTLVFEAICRPIRNEIDRLSEQDPARLAALNRAIHKIRIRLPTPNAVPLDLGLLIILNNEMDSEGADAVESFVSTIRAVVLNDDGAIQLEVLQLLYDEVSLSLFETTRPLDLDYVTNQGEEVLLGIQTSLPN